MPQRTLYEDWQLRRERFNTHEPLPHYTEQAKVFDYLLSRYADDPIAKEPAKFPLPAGCFFNSRAIIVNRHWGASETRGDASNAGTRAQNHLKAHRRGKSTG